VRTVSILSNHLRIQFKARNPEIGHFVCVVGSGAKSKRSRERLLVLNDLVREARETGEIGVDI
jgi:hypothetical protein